MTGLYLHKKTGSLYSVLAEGVDCTNDRDGTPVVIYCRARDLATTFVREREEFFTHFERLNDSETT